MQEYPSMPHISVGAVIVHDNRVLLIQRAQAPSKGLWSIPGGCVHLGESLCAALRREVREETGLSVTPGELIHHCEIIERDDVQDILMLRSPGMERERQVQDALMSQIPERIESDAEGKVRFHYVILDYLAFYTGGAARPSSDAAAVRWCDAQTALSMTCAPGIKALLKKAFSSLA